MTSERCERAILTELLELYREFPCLWNFSSDCYKDKIKKSEAWELLTDKLKVLEPGADIRDTKRRIEHMRTAYKREAKKVKESKRPGAGASEVHVPTLWYYKLLSFLDEDEQCKAERCKGDQCKDEQARTEVDTLASDEESRNTDQASEEIHKKRTRHNNSKLEIRKETHIETAQELLQQPTSQTSNSFSIYMSEQLDQVNTFQRHVAEKLIAEVLFLAKTGNLNFDSKIETPSRSFLYPSSSSKRQTSSSLSSPQSYSSQYREITQPQFILPCSSPQDIKSLHRNAPIQGMQPPSSCTIKPSPSPTFDQPSFTSPHRSPSPDITQKYDVTPCISSFQTIQTIICSPSTEAHQSSSPSPTETAIIQTSHSCHQPSSPPHVIQTSPSTEVDELSVPSPTDQTSSNVQKRPGSLLEEYLKPKKLQIQM